MSALNPEAGIRIHPQGAEREPVIVIDDALADPDRWRDRAAAERFAPIGPYYPGIRAPVPADWAADLRADLAPLVAKTFALDSVPAVLETYFSIVTTPPEALAPIQRLPHFDGMETARIAILLFLSGEAHGGTAFFRQRATGYETVTQDRFSAFEAALRQGVAQHGMPAPGYIHGDTALYERIALHEARPNRALIYRSRTLHCAAIPPGATFSTDPAIGRLTINSFLFDG